MNSRDPDVWQLAPESVIANHEMTLTKLPEFEMFEEGSQIRRAIKSVKSNIVEGDETADHSDTLVSTKSLRDTATIEQLGRRLDELGRKLNLFQQSVERSHQSEK